MSKEITGLGLSQIPILPKGISCTENVSSQEPYLMINKNLPSRDIHVAGICSAGCNSLNTS